MYFYLVSIAIYMNISDKISTILYKKYSINNSISSSYRWFFIHAMSNLLTCYLCYPDLKFCIKNVNTCAITPPTLKGKLAIYTSIISHLYHIIFFTKKLSYNDWVHHLSMMGISGTLSLFYATKVNIMGLWFLSGFPGLIDYSMLYCVKMGFIKSITQRYIYTLISAYIRSPGCLLTCFYCIPVLKDFKYTLNDCSLLINCLLLFINGQYYCKLACIDYGKKIINYHPYTKKEQQQQTDVSSSLITSIELDDKLI